MCNKQIQAVGNSTGQMVQALQQINCEEKKGNRREAGRLKAIEMTQSTLMSKTFYEQD